MAKLVEATYGDALYELAVSNNITDRLYDEAVVLLDIFDTDSELMDILNHPKIVREDRISIIENSIGKFVSKEMTGFLVTTPYELSDAMKSKVEKRLLETTDYSQIDINYNVDESLIGGMVIRIGDRVVDSSIKHKLADLTRVLNKIDV